MPPTLKKLMGHIAFGACVGGCVGGWVTLLVPTVTFKPLKLVLKFHIWIPHKKIANLCFFFFSELSPLLELWPFENF